MTTAADSPAELASPRAVSALTFPLATLTLAGGLLLAVTVRLDGLMIYDSQRVVQVGVTVLVALLLVGQPRTRREVGHLLAGAPRVTTAAAVVLALGVASAAGALSPRSGPTDVALLSSTVVVALVVAAETRRDPGTATTVVLALVTTTILCHMLPIIATADLDRSFDPVWARGGTNGGFAHPRFLNQFQVVAVPLMGVAATSRRWWVRVAAVTGIGVSGWAMTVTVGRGAGAALCIAVVATAVVAGPAGRRVAAWTAGPAVVGLGAGLLSIASRPGADLRPPTEIDANTAGATSALNGRETYWREALDRVGDAPFLGIGPGHTAHTAYTDPYTPGAAAHPHSSVFQVLAEWGVPAAVVLAAVVVVLLVGTVRRVRSVDGAVSPGSDVLGLGVTRARAQVGATTALTAALLLSTVSGVLVMPVALLALALTGGLALGLLSDDTGGPAPTRDEAGSRPAVVATAVLLAGSALLAVAVGPSPVADRRADSDAYVAGAPDDLPVSFRPRFWQQGLVGDG